jgi:hypothetical protein
LLRSAACASSWPNETFPEGIELERTLYADETWGVREGCVAMIGELTDSSRFRVGGRQDMSREGWRATPLVLKPTEHLYAKAALGGCNNDAKRPLGDLAGALQRPGAYYKIVNGGEGLAVIVPRAKLAGWFYFG